MTTSTPDPAQQWAHLLTRLDGRVREVVVETLRSSTGDGSVVTEDDVRLLVSYAAGDISAREYARRIAASLGISELAPAPRRRSVVAGPVPPVADQEAAQRRQVRREDAVQAYVTGEIPVSEFLRIARG
jgi:hypothetical protein